MEIIPVITVEELQDLTMNDDLLTVCSSAEWTALKIINQVSVRIWNKIDREQFYNQVAEEYVIPEDLKLACASLCESYYTYYIVDKNNNATKKVASERIDDYQYTYSTSESAYSFFGIPTDSNIIAILEAYSWVVWEWFWNVNLH